MAAGHHGNTGVGGRGGRWGCNVHNRNKLAAHLAAAQARESRVLLPPARSTTTGNPTDSGGAGAPGSLRTCRNTSRTVVRFPAGVKQTGVNEAMPSVATRATTPARPLLSAVVWMCRTFQNSSVNRVMRPCRDGMPGTLLPESRRRMSSMVTRALPNRATLRDADLTDRKGTWALDENGAGLRTGCRTNHEPAQARREGLA